MKKWSQITQPTTWSRIELMHSDYVVFIKEGGQEKALVSFQGIQMGHAVFFDGSRKDASVWYDHKSRVLCMSGPNNLMGYLKNLEPGQSYSPNVKDPATS